MNISFTKIQSVTVGAIACSFLFAICAAPTTSHAALTQKSGTTTAGLMGWWTFDEGTSTTANDFSISRNMGTLVNSPAWTTGKRGRSLLFNGSNTQVNVAETNLNPSTITVSTWVKLTGNQTSRVFIAKYFQSPTRGWGIGIDDSTTNVIKWYTSTESGTNNTLNSTFALTNGLWYHIVGTFDGTTKRLYINGVENNNVTWSNSIGYTSTVTGIGYLRFNGNQYFNGSIDDVKVYNSALSAADILAMYRAGEVVRKVADKTGLVGYWSFDEGTSTVAGDFSGNGNTGVIQGAAAWVAGKRGKAIQFDGVDDYIDLSSLNGDITAMPITISFWAKPSTGSPIGMFDSAPNQGNVLRNYSSGQVEWWSGDPAVNLNLDAGQWAYLAFVYSYDGNRRLAYYKNGVLQTTATGSTGSSFAWNNFRLGDINNGGSGRYTGVLDDVRIHNRALSASDVATLYRSNQTKVNSPQDTKLTSGLVGYWTFNGKDLSGSTALDVSGQNNHGTLGASPSATIGKVGQGLSFNGTSNYVRVTNASSLNTTSALTYSYWIKGNSFSNTPIPINNHIQGIGSPISGVVTWINPSGAVSFQLRVGNACCQAVTSATTIATGAWYHVVDTWDGATMKQYINGVQDVNTTSISGTLAVNRDTFFGTNAENFFGTPTAWLNGSLDEIRIYNRALSAAEAKQLYLMGK